uniref:hypothetical protein n=1 Tax=Porodaedalea mongolica TaxID=2651638 RepID=UPI0021AC016A|nr:hypothetical protein NYK79_mgp53 [Porodaedalea mongolica]UUA03937.1 hypothetical protein [Porodaedalea mongolica]WCF76697.1 hypothetical protein [Porodaedalea mongolica]
MIKIKNFMAYDHIKNVVKNIFKQIIETYLSILSLPMVYRSKSKLIIVLILVMVISSIVFNSGLYNSVSSNYGYLFVSATVLNIFFLKFNFIIRLFNVFYKSVIYFYAAYRNGNSNNKIVPTLRIIIFYYLYNILCFVLTILLVLRLENNLAEYSNIIAEYSYIYSILVAPTFALMYIGYTT